MSQEHLPKLAQEHLMIQGHMATGLHGYGGVIAVLAG